MVVLRRTVRFSINLDAGGRPVDPQPSYNTFAAGPSPLGLPRHYEILASCRGDAHPRTGYVINIQEVDRAVRHAAVPILAAAAADGSTADPIAIMPRMFGPVRDALLEANAVDCVALTLRLTPYHALEMTEKSDSTVLIRAMFDMAAAHRLHCADLTDEQNRALFGKCNNPSGHGHNYRVEPLVALDLCLLPAHPFTIQTLERITDDSVIRRFDHKHLNLDTAEFSEAAGVNPSVENIARVFFDLLAPRIREASPAATLRSITVWETDRTCAMYPG